MARFLVCGDTHGNMLHFEDLCDVAQTMNCTTIFQLGDWGYIWAQGPGLTYRNRMAQLDQLLADHGLTMMWLDGNHENFYDLKEFFGVDPNADHQIVMSKKISYFPRGLRFELDGIKCMSFGGAISIDQYGRTKFVSYWPDEEITDAQVARVESRPVDILFSHDVPLGGPHMDAFLAAPLWNLPEKLERKSFDNRIRMREVFNKVTPKILFHGHYHHGYTDLINESVVVGLADCSQWSRCYAVLDTDTWRGDFGIDA